MPNNIKVSDMEQAVELTKDDLVMIAQPNIDPENPEAEVESYSSKKTTVEDLANTTVKDIQFTSDLQTKSKTLTGAINEAAEVGKKSEELEAENFSTNNYPGDYYGSPCWIDSGETVDEHTVYKSDAGTYGRQSGDSLCKFSVAGYDDVTLYVKQDNQDTNRSYMLLGYPNESVNTSRYMRKYKDETLTDYEYCQYTNLNGKSTEIEALYHVESPTVPGSVSINLQDGQWVSTSETVGGNTVYKSQGGSYHIAEGSSKCIITVSGVSNFSIFCKPSSESGYDKTYIGKLDTTVSKDDSSTYINSFSGDGSSYTEVNYEINDANTHTIEILYAKDGGGDYYDDCGYIYFLKNGQPNESRGYVYIVPGTVHTPQGEVFNDYSHNYAIGLNSHAEGSYTRALGNSAHAEGYTSSADGDYSHAEGWQTKASYCSHTEGYSTKASYYGHAEGYETEAPYYGHAEGRQTKATGEVSHAEGWGTQASGNQGHAEGRYTIASGPQSHAEGCGTQALGQYSHAEGYGANTPNIASGQSSHTEGYGSLASGTCAHAEGSGCTASGGYSHAEGESTIASESEAHAEGHSTRASGFASHAEGNYTTASGLGAHSEGYEYTTASGDGSHAEGNYTEASGVGAHAEGNGYNSSTKNIASGSGSHAEGYGTRATGSNSHAEGGGWGGQYNIASGTASHAEGGGNNAIGPCSHVEGTRNTVYSDSGHADGSGNTVYGHEAHGEGAGTITAGEQGHSEGAGNTNVADKGHIEGAGNRNTYNASISHTEGGGNTNYGIQGHVEGSGNTLSGEESHVEGAGNRVHGPKSHGEGGGNVTYGLGSHIEGKHNVAVGYGQHAEGINNIIGATEEPDYFSYGTTYLPDAIVAVNDLYRDNSPYSGTLEPTTPFLFKCIREPGQIQETTGVQIVTASEWSSSTTYQAGSVVKVSGVGLYTNPSESTGKHPAIKSNGWNRISAILSPFYSCTPSSKSYYLLDCDGGIYSSKVAIVDANTTVAAMWEPVTTPMGSHIEGLGNISTGYYQHVQGKYNTADSTKTFIIGNGTADDARSNAMAVDWYGNMTLAGDITVGAINGTISDLATRIPAAPTTDGNYILSVTVSSGVPTYSWIAAPT